MSHWKVILATMVIFGSGVVTGGFVVRKLGPAPSAPAPSEPPFSLQRIEMMRFVVREVGLEPAQRTEMEKIFDESRDRVVILHGLIAPEANAEWRTLHESVRAKLTPPQRQRFEEEMAQRARFRNAKQALKGGPNSGPGRPFVRPPPPADDNP